MLAVAHCRLPNVWDIDAGSDVAHQIAAAAAQDLVAAVDASVVCGLPVVCRREHRLPTVLGFPYSEKGVFLLQLDSTTLQQFADLCI